MKSLRIFVAAILLIVSGSAMAQSQKALSQLMRDRGEYYFTLNVDEAAEIQNLGERCSIDGTDGHTIVAYANQEEYDQLLAAGYRPTLQTPPSLREEAKMWDGNRATYQWDSYLTYPQYVSMMEGFPTLALSDRSCTLIDLGQLSTTNHRHLLGVRINNSHPEGKPKFLYTSTMHGDEVTGMILMLRLIDELCTSTDTRIVNLLNELDIYVFPCTNPDGTYYNGNNTVTGARRYNGNNKDLNRNYKDFFNGDHPDNNSYQEETLWTMALADENLFTMGANYHGGSEVMNYCWDWVFENHADTDWWEYVCTEYVQLARQVNSNYMGGYNQGSNNYDYDGVTRGATWYSITGSRQDYMNAFGQCREVTVECSTTKTPNASQLPNFWNYNHNSMLTLMEQAYNGVHGIVKDAVSGQPIQGVTVSVLNHDINHSYVTTHAAGDFHRPIKGGTYTFVFDKEGYARKFVEVTVADGQREDLMVNLTSSDAPQLHCFTPFVPDAPGIYLLGHLDGSNLIMPTHNNTSTSTSVSMAAASLPATTTDDGFTVTRGTELRKISLNPSGTNGQYYIAYKGRLLSRSSTTLSWAKPSNASGSGVNLSSYRWYVNADGIYQQSGSTKYYLTCSNGAFKVSTTNNNTVGFFTEGECPTPVTTQTVSLISGWNWFVPTVETSLAELEAALGENGMIIKTQTQSVFYEEGEWDGDNIILTPGQMYKIKVQSAATIAITGNNITTIITVSIKPGSNWFGYIGPKKNINAVLSDCGFEPTEGDIIKTRSQSTFFEGGEWDGDFESLQSGQGYIYISKDHNTKQLRF